MGCGFTLSAERSSAPTRRLGGALPQHFLCKVKPCFFPFVLLCLFCIFYDNKSMFHRLLRHWRFYFPTQLRGASATGGVTKASENRTSNSNKRPFVLKVTANCC